MRNIGAPLWLTSFSDAPDGGAGGDSEAISISTWVDSGSCPNDPTEKMETATRLISDLKAAVEGVRKSGGVLTNVASTRSEFSDQLVDVASHISRAQQSVGRVGCRSLGA